MQACNMRATMFLAKADLDRPDPELRALRTPTDPAAVANLARAAAESLLGRPIATVTPTPHPVTFHDVAIVTFADSLEPTTVVVRLSRRPEWGSNTELLVDSILSPLLVRAGVNAPAILACDLSRSIVSTDLQIQALAPGHCLREFDHDDSLISPFFPAVAGALASVGSVAVQGAGPIDVSVSRDQLLTGLHPTWSEFLTLRLADHAGLCLAAGLIDRAEQAKIDRAFENLLPAASRQPLGLVHGDPGNHNVFVDGERITLIDWEDALAGDPLMDLANWATFHPERRWPTFFASIPGTGPSSGDETQDSLFWLYFLRLALAKTAHRLRFGTPDAPGRPPASRRIQRALDALAGLGVINSTSAGGGT